MPSQSIHPLHAGSSSNSDRLSLSNLPPAVQHGHSGRLDAHVVNYADDLVICCPPGNGKMALATMRRLMGRLGLTVNDQKTRIACLPEGAFDFLGYTVGRFYGKDGRAFIGTEPSRKSIRRIVEK